MLKISSTEEFQVFLDESSTTIGPKGELFAADYSDFEGLENYKLESKLVIQGSHSLIRTVWW